MNYKQRSTGANCGVCGQDIAEGEAAENPTRHEQCQDSLDEAQKEENYQRQMRYIR